MVERQKQKQKQTVIVNIGDKVVKRKRKGKPRKKAVPGPPRLPPAPPPSQDFARVIYQAQAMRPDENLAVQLNSVAKQLQTLKDKQDHSTANLMAGEEASKREKEAKERADAAMAQQLQDEERQRAPEQTDEATQTKTDEELQLERFMELAQIAEASEKANIRGRDTRARSQPPRTQPPQVAFVATGGGGGFPEAEARRIEEPQGIQAVAQLGGGGGGQAEEPPKQKKILKSRGGGGGAADDDEEETPLKIKTTPKQKGPGRQSKAQKAAEEAKQSKLSQSMFS